VVIKRIAFAALKTTPLVQPVLFGNILLKRSRSTSAVLPRLERSEAKNDKYV
jgi:hypothetical protein